MNKITLKNIAMDELQLLIKNASYVYSNMTEAELKAASESKDKTLAKMVARKIQPKLEEMQHANPFKKAFLIFKYVVLGNKNAKCTIPREALESFARTILPDIIAFCESEKGKTEIARWKEKQETDRKIGELTGSPSPEPLSNYIFDADEVTVGDLVAIDEELQHQKDLLEEEPKEPYLSGLIAVSPGEPTEKIAVISVPSEAIISDESPFIAVEDL
jgi:hypothetical protein